MNKVWNSFLFLLVRIGFLHYGGTQGRPTLKLLGLIKEKENV